MKLALGTVQFGLDYGVANQRGRIPQNEAAQIIALARAKGIRVLDTAIAYGDSEEVLGNIGVQNADVITKLPAFPDECTDIRAWVRQQVEGSLRRLKVDKVHGLLLHRPAQLAQARGHELYEAMNSLKAMGKVDKIGISIYRPDELKPILPAMKIDIVQAPFNILDRRLISSGWMDQLVAQGVELHVRSVFMQGLLLLSNAQRPRYFRRWDALWTQWEQWLTEQRLSPLQACLRYAAGFAAISKIVVGVDSAAHFEAIAEAASGPMPPVPDALQSSDEDLLEPTRWKRDE